MASMTMMVCPHDTAGDPVKWFQFAQFISKYCQVSTKYYKCLDFVEFHQKMSEADLVYANPQDSLTLLEKFGYVPLVHSTNLYDEIVFIAAKDADATALSALDGSECLSCNGMMVTRVGVKALQDEGILPAVIDSKDNWMAVVKAISQGEKPYGFVYKDFYDGLNNLSQGQVNIIAETSERSIFHSLFIKAEHAAANGQAICAGLMAAHDDAKGMASLQGINVEQFVPVSRDEILQFKSLLAMGADIMTMKSGH